jgi:hypothetical protein
MKTGSYPFFGRIRTLLPERRSPTRHVDGTIEKRAGSEIGAPNPMFDVRCSACD